MTWGSLKQLLCAIEGVYLEKLFIEPSLVGFG